MKFQSILLTVFIASTGIEAALNEPCYGSGGAPGVCVTTTSCSAEGGTTVNGACPRDPANVKCCTKPTCTSAGNCRWSSDCVGSSLTGACPGPGAFKCCQSSANGFGGYPAPRIPTAGTSSSACKAVSVAGARKIVAAFPGRVREIGCTRACACGSGSDHCCGKATDMMCSDAGGTATTSGKEIAEWCMRNAGSLNMKYVIWGQRIWETGDGVKVWSSWTTMEDRGDVTQNHWDHVHVSYN